MLLLGPQHGADHAKARAPQRGAVPPATKTQNARKHLRRGTQTQIEPQKQPKSASPIYGRAN
eukprot:8701684-Alexandrium_andersonii.AAC.1